MRAICIQHVLLMTTKETTSIYTPDKFHLTDKHIHVLVNVSTLTKESYIL